MPSNSILSYPIPSNSICLPNSFFFLLGRMGNNKKALHLIIKELRDVENVSSITSIFLPRILCAITYRELSLLGHRVLQGTK